MSQEALKIEPDAAHESQPPRESVADAKKANKNLYRPGYYQDEEGHRRMLDAMGVEMGADPAAALEADERKWPLYRTITLVVLVNVLAWAGLIMGLRAIF